MSVNIHRWIVGALFVGFSMSGYAQEGSVPNLGAGGEVQAASSSPSLDEQKTQSEKFMAEIKTAFERIQQLAQIAREEKDVIRLNCVNDKLIQAKGHTNVAEEAHGAWVGAYDRKDESAASHEFSRISIVHQKMVILGQEAENCIGEEMAYVEETAVEQKVDSAITQEDPVSKYMDQSSTGFSGGTVEAGQGSATVDRLPTASPLN